MNTLSALVGEGLTRAKTAVILGTVDVPNPDPALPGDMSAKMERLIGVLKAIAIFGLVGAAILAGVGIAFAFFGHQGAEKLKGLFYVAGGAAVVGFASGLISFILN